MVKRFAFAVPGNLATPTGGYIYDRRMIAELTQLGWRIEAIDLGGSFPRVDAKMQATAQARLAPVPERCPIVIDGLAYGALPELAVALCTRHPLIALVHHPLALESGLSAAEVEKLRTSERSALAAAHHVITTSATTARLLIADYDVPADRVTVARPGTDPVPAAHGSHNDTVRLLAVGAVVPRKGYDVLVAALATLADLPWRLTIAGDCERDPATTAWIQSEIARCHLAEQITVIGAVTPERLAELYRTADLFVLASRFEGYGMAFAEAIAYGLPVVGTTAGAIPETVSSEAAVLIASNDPTALSDALRRLIMHESERHRLALAARAAAAHLPTWRDSAALFAGAIKAAA